MHSDLEATVVGVVGAPNAGKTTLYNWLTGARYRPVNYPGSTVDFALGTTLEAYGSPMTILDTPGVYSLNAQSPEEEVTFSVLYKNEEVTQPGIIIAVVDATQVSRHLFLVRQLLEGGHQIVIAVTMLDLLKKRGLKFDSQLLSQSLNVPVIEIDGRLGGGVKELMSKVRGVQRSTQRIQSFRPWSKEKVESIYKELDDLESKVIVPISGGRSKLRADDLTLKLDHWLMHPFYGILLFIAILGGLFSSIFWMAQPLMDFIDEGFSGMADAVAAALPASLFTDFLTSGLISGVGSVLVFVPQIFILFFGLVLLEDWGYLARAAAVIDKPLSKIGLNGRSFVPLLSGFACAIPAMMAARTISSKKERWITVFIIPLMSCSARLPVYALLLAYLFQGSSAITAGFVLAVIYMAALFTGMLAAGLASKFVKTQEPSWFMLELPVYRRPRMRAAIRSASDRTISYLKKAGPAILIFSLIIWAGTVFPNYHIEDSSERLANSYAAKAGQFIEPVMEPMGADWRVGVGLISAFAAREVFVSSLALIFNLTETDDDSLQQGLLETMRTATRSDGSLLFTTSTVIGLIVFFMISLQCLSTVAVSKKETGSWKFALTQLFVFTAVAWLSSVFVVQALRVFGVS